MSSQTTAQAVPAEHRILRRAEVEAKTGFTRSNFGSHDAIEFTHGGHAYLVGLPLFALHKEFFRTLGQDEVNTAVRTAPTDFCHAVSLKSVGFTDQQLKLPPAHAVQGVGIACLRHVRNQGLALFAPPG